MYVCMYGKVLDALAFFFYHLPTLEPSQILFSYVFALTIARARAPSAAKMLTDKAALKGTSEVASKVARWKGASAKFLYLTPLLMKN